MSKRNRNSLFVPNVKDVSDAYLCDDVACVNTAVLTRPGQSPAADTSTCETAVCAAGCDDRKVAGSVELVPHTILLTPFIQEYGPDEGAPGTVPRQNYSAYDLFKLSSKLKNSKHVPADCDIIFTAVPNKDFLQLRASLYRGGDPIETSPNDSKALQEEINILTNPQHEFYDYVLVFSTARSQLHTNEGVKIPNTWINTMITLLPLPLGGKLVNGNIYYRFTPNLSLSSTYIEIPYTEIFRKEESPNKWVQAFVSYITDMLIRLYEEGAVLLNPIEEKDFISKENLIPLHDGGSASITDEVEERSSVYKLPGRFPSQVDKVRLLYDTYFCFKTALSPSRLQSRNESELTVTYSPDSRESNYLPDNFLSGLLTIISGYLQLYGTPEKRFSVESEQKTVIQALNDNDEIIKVPNDSPLLEPNFISKHAGYRLLSAHPLIWYVKDDKAMKEREWTKDIKDIGGLALIPIDTKVEGETRASLEGNQNRFTIFQLEKARDDGVIYIRINTQKDKEAILSLVAEVDLQIVGSHYPYLYLKCSIPGPLGCPGIDSYWLSLALQAVRRGQRPRLFNMRLDSGGPHITMPDGTVITQI